MDRRRRPLGVAILGGLVGLTGIALVLIGLAGVFVSLAALIPGTGLSFASLFLGGLAFAAVGVVLIVAGGGLFMMRSWAWWLAVVAVSAALAYTLFGALSVGRFDLSSAIASALEVIVLAYLVSVYREFRSGIGVAVVTRTRIFGP